MKTTNQNARPAQKLVRLADVCSLVTERVPVGSASRLRVDLEHIESGTGLLTDDAVPARPEGTRTGFQRNDILFGKLRPYLRKTHLATEDGECTTEIWVLRARTDIVNPRYLHCVLRCQAVQRLANATSGTKMPRADWEHVAEAPVWLPTSAVQDQIANADIALEQTGRLLTRSIAAKREQKRGLMQQLLTGKVRFPGFTEPWKTVAIGDLVEEHARKVVWDDERIYRLISIRRRNGGVFPRAELPGSKILTKSLFSVETGDLLVSCRQVVHGAIAVVPSELSGSCVSGEYLCMRERKGAQVESGFLNLLAHLPAMRKLTMNCSYGVHIEKLNLDVPKFMRSKVHVAPTLEEQLRIVRIFNLIEHELTLLQAHRVALASQRRGLMEQLLSGHITIPSSDTSAA